MATKKTAVKPATPVVHARAIEPTADASTYQVTGRIWRNGQLLRPANPDTGREADTVDLTEREAYGLRGFVTPITPPANAE